MRGEYIFRLRLENMALRMALEELHEHAYRYKGISLEMLINQCYRKLMDEFYINAKPIVAVGDILRHKRLRLVSKVVEITDTPDGATWYSFENGFQAEGKSILRDFEKVGKSNGK